MSKRLWPEVADPEQRLRLLRDNCDRLEHEDYSRELTQHEMDQRREMLADNCIAINGHEGELKEIKDEFKRKIDPLKQHNVTLLQEIKTGRVEEQGDLFYIADHENGMMEVFDKNGELVRSRRLTPDEKQGRLFPIKQAQAV
jgi:hypothetical protein